MATKAQVKRIITPRIQSKLPKLTFSQYVQAVQALSAEERQELVNAWNSGSIQRQGIAVERLRESKRKDLAEARADEILANDSIDLSEFDEVR